MTSIEERIYAFLSDHWTGGNDVPGTSKAFHFGESWPDIANVHNDGYELWIGTMNEWHTHMNRPDAHRLAWFILWEWWGKGEWFGLKRWLWYKLLTRRIGRHFKDVALT